MRTTTMTSMTTLNSSVLTVLLVFLCSEFNDLVLGYDGDNDRDRYIEQQLKAMGDCQTRVLENPPKDDGKLYCYRTFDGWGCWDDTLAGTRAFIPCPTWANAYFDPKLTAFKDCNADGQWFVHPESQYRWSNYTTCIDREESAMRLRRQIGGFEVSHGKGDEFRPSTEVVATWTVTPAAAEEAKVKRNAQEHDFMLPLPATAGPSDGKATVAPIINVKAKRHADAANHGPVALHPVGDQFSADRFEGILRRKRNDSPSSTTTDSQTEASGGSGGMGIVTPFPLGSVK